MKPIQLTMSAFGSYADTTIIDFSRVKNGIFLITGDTGSGKTTIFDAICYALYDRTSGGAREGSDMRSQYADPGTATYVEYTFSYGEAQYTVRRNPRYSRTSKRKDKEGNYKETIEQPSVELIMPDGRSFAGKLRETNEKIIEIIGLDADQFTQIAMIAQGEFMKLLQAPSNKRKEIFAKIFNTRIYWQIQETLKQYTRKLYIALEDNRKFCEMELASIRALPDIDSPGGQQPFDFTEYDEQALLERLNKLLQEGTEQEKLYKTRITDNQKAQEQANAALTAGEQINRLFLLLDKAKQEREKLEQKKKEYEDKAEQLERARKAVLVSVEREKAENRQKALTESNRRLKDYETAMQKIKKELENCEAQKVNADSARQEKEPGLQEQLARLRGALPQYEQADQYKQTLSQQESELIALQRKQAKAQERMETIQHELLAAHEKVTETLHAYEQANDAFIAEQAGIMAANLQEGMPCPVCGSTIHPHKAGLSAQAVTQEQVKAAKVLWTQAEETENRINMTLMSARKKQEEEQEAYHNMHTAYETAKAQYILLKEQLILDGKQEAQKQIKTLEKELLRLQEQAAKAQENWQLTREQLTRIMAMKKSEEEQNGRFVEELAEAQETYRQTLDKQGFATKEDYLASLLSVSQMETLEKTISIYHDTCVRNEAAVHQCEKQTRGKERIDTQSLQQEVKELQSTRRELDNRYREIYGINQRNREALEKLTRQLDTRKTLKEEYEMYSNLDKTANGNLAGTAKLDFQTYIQRKYFEAIIREANKRLVKMTSNQFILQCRSLDKLGSQGAVGLDLDVYSLVNDKTRDVKTLSGGESFMAALSMALGMSDVIQNTAGKVRMDTMFVDEGFGSLDDEARNEAIKILNELAGEKRLVGIISHVTELKEQIDRKLVVTKDEKGSSISWQGLF